MYIWLGPRGWHLTSGSVVGMPFCVCGLDKAGDETRGDQTFFTCTFYSAQNEHNDIESNRKNTVHLKVTALTRRAILHVHRKVTEGRDARKCLLKVCGRRNLQTSK